jgi:hypothetical protein
MAICSPALKLITSPTFLYHKICFSAYYTYGIAVLAVFIVLVFLYDTCTFSAGMYAKAVKMYTETVKMLTEI